MERPYYGFGQTEQPNRSSLGSASFGVEQIRHQLLSPGIRRPRNSTKVLLLNEKANNVDTTVIVAFVDLSSDSSGRVEAEKKVLLLPRPSEYRTKQPIV